MANLFGTSGIRDIVNKDIDSRFVIRISKAISSIDEDFEKVLIGRDSRISGKMIMDAITSGFLSCGLEIDNLGVVPTPVVAFNVSETDADFGVMITASHNPPEYNGIKLFDSDGKPFSSKREREIEKAYGDKNYKTANWNKIKNTQKISGIENYLNKIIEGTNLEKEYITVTDCTSGPSALTTPYLLEKLGCRVSTINSQLDGRFPGRKAEPKDENLTDLKKMVKSTDADVGFAHDGDGDRVAVIDEQGRFVEMDKLLALLGKYSADRFKEDIVTTVDASNVVDTVVKEEDSEVLRTEVGDVNVSQKMYEKGINFGGEPSGSFIVGDYHLCADGTLAAVRVLEVLDNYDKPLSEIIDNLPEYPVMRGNVACPENKKEQVMKLVSSEIVHIFENIVEVLTIDGIRLEFENGGWLLVRPSGTEPYVRITVEASDREKAQDYTEKAEEYLESKIDSL